MSGQESRRRDHGRVVVVHDYLTQRGGAERVVLALARALGGEQVVTSLYEPATSFPEFERIDVRTSGLQRLGPLRRHHRLALPLLAPIFSRLQVDADLVVCSTTGWAHGARATGTKVLYVNNTARWLYQADEYLVRVPGPARRLVSAGLAPLRHWDRRAATSADLVIANSANVAGRIRRHWGIDPVVVTCPHSADPAGPTAPVPGVEPGFHLAVSRLLAYKHIDAILGAARLLPDRRFVVVGDGPERRRLDRLAGPNVTLLHEVDDQQLRWLYRSCRAAVVAAHEDFGLVPVEAMAFGKPVAALRAGGYLETVLEGQTGLFFDRPEAPLIAEVLRKLEATTWDGAIIAARAEEFSEAAFTVRLRAAVGTLDRPPEQDGSPSLAG